MNRKEDIMFDKIRKLKIKFINFKNENDKKKRYNKLFKDNEKTTTNTINNKNNIEKNTEKINMKKVKEVRPSSYCCSSNRNRVHKFF